MTKLAQNSKRTTITSSELKLMLKKYMIGKKPLAKLLGWGVTTVLLYTNMDDIPEGEYAQKLYSLYNNPGEYYELLNENKEQLTEVAYRKSLNAVNEIMLGGKLLTAAQMLINRANAQINVSRIEAVLLYSQIVSLVLYDEPIFDDEYQALRGNLPYRHVTARMDGGCFCMDYNKDILSERDHEILASIYDTLEWYGNKAIQTLLAAERFRLCGKPGEKTRRTVSKEMMKRCYKEVFEQAHVHKLKDIDLYIQRRMNALKKSLTNSATV